MIIRLGRQKCGASSAKELPGKLDPSIFHTTDALQASVRL